MITEGYLAQHYHGRRGGRDVALLDVCQDYALELLRRRDIFDLGVVLKGGTSLRKFRAGNAGRFSTDLDFATPDGDTAKVVMEMLDGAELFDVRIRVTDQEELRGRLEFVTPLGNPNVAARLELSPRPLWLPTVLTSAVPLAVHKGYDFAPAALLVPAVEESMAEKLAAWRRRQKMRDLYDLYWFGQGALDEPLVRRLFVLKVWHDVVNDGLGQCPLDPGDVIADVDLRKIAGENIGLLTQPVEPDRWLRSVRERYRFVTALDADEERVARCSPADAYFVGTLVQHLVPGT